MTKNQVLSQRKDFSFYSDSAKAGILDGCISVYRFGA